MMMKSFFQIIPMFIVLGLVNSCVDSYQPDIDSGNNDPVLVVEGQVTNETGPFRVKLTTTFPLDNLQLTGDSVTDANVTIMDDQGHFYQLVHTTGGLYETEDKNLKGIPGNTYVLNITTLDGMQYESTPVTMLDVPDIDSVYFREENVSVLENGVESTQKRLNIYVDARASNGPPEFLRYAYDDTWEIKLSKHDVRIRTGSTNSTIVTDDVELAPGITETCWITKPSTSILVASGKNTSDNRVSDFKLTSIPQNNDRLYIKYSILVKQYAMTESMYNFWKVLKESNENNGGMYDRIPSQIYGNIECCSHTGNALGYFTASAVKEKRIFIAPGDQNMKTKSPYDGCIYVLHPNPRVVVFVYGHSASTGETVYTQDVYCSDCTIYGSSVEPDFWE
jgi:hypothetical protein